jgi:hypothetical protein
MHTLSGEEEEGGGEEEVLCMRLAACMEASCMEASSVDPPAVLQLVARLLLHAGSASVQICCCEDAAAISSRALRCMVAAICPNREGTNATRIMQAGSPALSCASCQQQITAFARGAEPPSTGPSTGIHWVKHSYEGRQAAASAGGWLAGRVYTCLSMKEGERATVTAGPGRLRGG